MTTSHFMDKQTMDLSSSQTKNDFIDLNRATDQKEAILPNYDFQPIRPIASSSPPSRFDSAGPRTWNSSDRNYSSLDSFEPPNVISEKDHNTVDPTLMSFNVISEIDRTMKKYADNLLHALDGVSARLTQLDTRTRHLESSVDDLKVSVGNNHGNSDGRMRQLENILREVLNGVQLIKDKQEIVDAHLQLAKVQISNVQQPAVTQSLERVESSQSTSSAAQQSHQQLPSGAPQPTTAFIPLNAPPPSSGPPPPPQQGNVNVIHQLDHFSPNQIHSLPQREPYFPPPGQAPENLGQQFQVPPQQLQAASPLPPPPQQYPPPQLQYSQQPAPPQQPIFSNVNPPQQPPPIGHQSEEPPYMQSQSYPPSIHQPPSHPPNAAPPPPHYYAPPPPNMYDSPSNRPGPGFSGSYGPPPGSGEPYPYGNSSQYGSSSPRKSQQQHSSPAMGHSGGGGYPQLPTARPLPHALPTASGVGSGVSGSANSGNKVPIEDVVEKVTHMGFHRDQVRETVRKLIENGQAVDLNIVLDKLMNDGDGHSRAWFNR